MDYPENRSSSLACSMITFSIPSSQTSTSAPDPDPILNAGLALTPLTLESFLEPFVGRLEGVLDADTGTEAEEAEIKEAKLPTPM